MTQPNDAGDRQMTQFDECIHGLDRPTCVLCNGRRPEPVAVRTFPAKFESQCPVCDLPIRVGDIVAWMPEHRATHEGCWS